jgi:hypothetical protein
MTHERRLEDLLANPVFSQGLSPQEAEIFQAMCGELSGLASQIAGSITAEQVNQASPGTTVNFLALFQSISTVLGDDAGEESPWEQFQEQIEAAQATLAEICQGPVSPKEVDTARNQVEGLLRQIDQMGRSGAENIRCTRCAFWDRFLSQVKPVLFYKLF